MSLLSHLTVFPKGKPVLALEEPSDAHSNYPLTIAVGERVEFTCKTDDIKSNPDVSAFTFFIDGEKGKIHNSSIWDPLLSMVNDTGTYTCTTNNSLGESAISNSQDVIVQGKLKLIDQLN